MNGTKLLAVARKYSLNKHYRALESCLNLKVSSVKSGPKDLFGIWIAFDQALELVKSYTTTADFYPLFEDNLTRFLDQATSQGKRDVTKFLRI